MFSDWQLKWLHTPWRGSHISLGSSIKCIIFFFLTWDHSLATFSQKMWLFVLNSVYRGLPLWLSNAGHLSLIPGLGRSPGEGKGYPLQYSGLENYSPWGCKELDTTERLSLHFTSVFIEEKKKDFIFRRVSGSQQNWVERKESSHTHLPPPPMDNLPPNQHVTRIRGICLLKWMDQHHCTRGHSLLQGSLLVLHILWLWQMYNDIWASLVAQTVKNFPAMQETCVQSLGWEDPLEKGMLTHSSTTAWRIPWAEGNSPWVRKESDTTKHLIHTHNDICLPFWYHIE